MAGISWDLIQGLGTYFELFCAKFMAPRKKSRSFCPGLYICGVILGTPNLQTHEWVSTIGKQNSKISIQIEIVPKRNVTVHKLPARLGQATARGHD